MRTRILFIILILGLLGLWFYAGRKNHSAIAASDRPNDPWVFRSVLDKQPRMITFALNDQLWVSYSTDSCSLYKAWAGNVDFSGAVYNMRHGPQPMSVGNAWFENKYRQPWKVLVGGAEQAPHTDYKGHRYTADGHAEIMYDLVLTDGRRIRINERPEYVDRDRQPGFERTFRVENCPDDVKVVLRTNVASVAAPSNIQGKGGNFVVNKSASQVAGDITVMTVDGDFTLAPQGESHLITMFVNTPQVENLNRPEDDGTAGENVVVHPGEKIMAKMDCRTCHNPQVKTVGPAYVDIAKRYKNIPENVEKLTQKVIAGGSGVWGIAAMSAHPNLSPDDAKAMVSYVLGLDDGEDDGEGSVTKTASLSDIPAGKWLQNDATVADGDLSSGLLVNVYQLPKSPSALNEINFGAKPSLTATIAEINAGNADFDPYKDNFAALATGYLYLEKDDNLVLQLSSDDGSRIYIDGKMLIDNDGPHGMDPKETEIALRKGFHPVQIEYFQGGGGRGITLKWARAGKPDMEIIPAGNWSHKRGAGEELPQIGANLKSIPGDGAVLKEVHPSYTVTQARPDEFLPKVAGMDFLPDGRLLVSTWDAMGGVYILDHVDSGDPKKITVKQFARGLAEPLGLKVVNGEIYVLQKQELTRLVDTDGDDVADEYQCFAKGWKASANFHEFAFGLAYQPEEDAFYAALATAIMPGGASARPQIADRGKVLKINRKDGSMEFVARGLRTPDGVGIGPDGQVFIADNQGDWLPASKIVHVKPGAFFGSFSVDSAAVASMPVQQPVVWLPQDEIGNSPTQPILLNDGPYQNQLIHGDVCYGGLQREFIEKVNGNYQGAVFRFSQGFEGATHRIVKGADGAYYLGMIGNPGNWSQEGKFWYGLQRMKFNGNSAFEMLAVRAKTNGVEIEFTEPLRDGDGWDVKHYAVNQWWYKPTKEYGGPKLDEENLSVISASVSPDRKKVFLEIPGIQKEHVVHIRLQNLPLSDLGHEIWTTEAWYTMNAIPQNDFGQKTPPPAFAQAADNTLSEKEKVAGWELLFDGQSINGWHNWGKTTIGAAWVIDEGAIHLQTKPKGAGEWQQKNGGDILTAGEYKDFELTLDWKIGACGNSGIIYNVIEDPSKYDYVWQTGPEMQVLDNTCHPDSKFPKHRAGDLYDLIACKYETVKPAGQWNHIRLISKGGKVEHWLNDRKLVEVQMFNDEWWKLIGGSKFKDMPAFGRSPKGKIALQDHGDPVWFKNVKIRKL
jgi:cytochrome c